LPGEPLRRRGSFFAQVAGGCRAILALSLIVHTTGTVGGRFGSLQVQSTPVRPRRRFLRFAIAWGNPAATAPFLVEIAGTTGISLP
jgi:hypothetical protein